MDNQKLPDIQLVISRYNEDLEWLKEEPFRKYPVICYNKGPDDKFYKPDKMKITNLENLGRCDHTYIYHILKNYDNLPEHTLFLPGSCDIPAKKEKAIRWIKEIEKENVAIFIGHRLNQSVKDALYDFTLNEWKATDKRNQAINPESKLQLHDIRPFGKWHETHFGDTGASHYTLGGVMGIHKQNILSRPKSEYEKFEKELNRHSNPEVGHYYERAWASIFNINDNNVVFIKQ